MGWVYYWRYYDYFEVARSELIRTLWKSYRRIEDEDGLKLPVVKSSCTYASGARYEDEIEIHTILTVNGAILHFDYKVYHAITGAEIATGFTDHCFMDSTGKPQRPPTSFMEFMKS